MHLNEPQAPSFFDQTSQNILATSAAGKMTLLTKHRKRNRQQLFSSQIDMIKKRYDNGGRRPYGSNAITTPE